LKRALALLVVVGCSKAAPPSATVDAAPPVAAPTDPNEIRYLALGDSFTIGTGSTPEQAFPARLADRWTRAGKKVTLKNLGVNGYTTDDLTERELPEVAPFHPTLVTLAIGANDRVHKYPVAIYRRHIKSILDSIVKAGVPAAHIVALPQPDWALSPAALSFGTPESLGQDIVQFNAALKEEATGIGARYIDIYPLMQKQAEAKMLAGDGLHPNAQAHDEWAAELVKSLP
jgi:lysophospholipase L1-like esterase